MSDQPTDSVLYLRKWAADIRAHSRKSVDADLLGVVRGAYLLACERQIARLQHAIAVEEERSGDADDSDLVDAAEALLARLKKARTRGLISSDPPATSDPVGDEGARLPDEPAG